MVAFVSKIPLVANETRCPIPVAGGSGELGGAAGNVCPGGVVLKNAAAVLLLSGCFCSASAQDVFFVGLAGGVSTLSGDARSVVTSASAAVSLYSPRNGPVLNVFA